MIAMQMADEDMIDFVNGYLVAHQLHLCAFSAINQEMPVLYYQVL
jgi:hypothetical protein